MNVYIFICWRGEGELLIPVWTLTMTQISADYLCYLQHCRTVSILYQFPAEYLQWRHISHHIQLIIVCPENLFCCCLSSLSSLEQSDTYVWTDWSLRKRCRLGKFWQNKNLSDLYQRLEMTERIPGYKTPNKSVASQKSEDAIFLKRKNS